MSNQEAENCVETPRSNAATDAPLEEPLADIRQLIGTEVPAGVDRRIFLMRVAVGGAAAVMTGCAPTPEEQTAKAVATATPASPAAAPAAPPLAEDLYVAMKS